MSYSNRLQRIRELIEKEYGDVGTRIYQKSILKLKINENPSRKDIETLISDISRTFVKLYGKNESKEIFDELQKELMLEDRSVESQLKDKLDYFFRTNGIPRESDIHDLMKHLIANGYNQDEGVLMDKLKNLSKERIISALNNSIVHSSVMTFLNKFQSYTEQDVEDFIKHLKFKKLIINDTELKDAIEKERLFRKFSEIESRENEETLDEKISRAYIALYHSSMSTEDSKKISGHYSYLLKPDDSLTKFIKNIEII